MPQEEGTEVRRDKQHIHRNSGDGSGLICYQSDKRRIHDDEDILLIN